MAYHVISHDHSAAAVDHRLPILMGVALALVYAVVVGVSDFLGGFAGRLSTFRASSAVAYATQALFVIALMPWLGGTFTSDVWRWGILVGFAFAITGVALFGGIGKGRPTVVAPLSAIVSALIPLAVSILQKVEMSPLQWWGIGLAIAAVLAATREGSQSADRLWFSVGAGIVAGAGISIIYFGTEATNDHGIAVLAPASLVAAALLSLSLIVDGSRFPTGRGLAWAAATGGTMTLGLVAFITATTLANLAIIAVVGSLYPAATVALAALVWRHRPTWPQWTGLVLAVAALALLAL